MSDNQEHIAILEKGVSTWNQWRRENPKIIPRVTYHDFKGLDLRGINFTNADLIYGEFENCDIRDSDLRGAELYSSDLRGAKLAGAKLQNASLNAVFFPIELDGIDFTDVDLRLLLNLDEINLRGASLYGA